MGRLLRDCLLISVLLFAYLCTGAWAVLPPNSIERQRADIQLTPAERAWLDEHPEITVAHTFNWPPYSFLDQNNQPVGPSIDFFELVAEIAGFKIKVHPDGHWNSIFEAGKNKQVDVVASMTISKEREQWFSFPRPYLSLSSYIITRKDDQTIKHRDDLKGKKLSGARGTWQIDDVLENYPSVAMDYVDTYSEALMAVSLGNVDATVITLGSALYDITEKGIYNLQLIPYEENTDSVSFGVRKDWPELAAIIDKALAAIPKAKQMEILSRWTPSLKTLELSNSALTKDEKAWLQQNPTLRLGVKPDWAPFEYLDPDGSLAGISSDNVRILAEWMGVTIEPVKGLTWVEVLEAAQRGEVDILSAAVKNEESSNHLLFTTPYLQLPMVIFMSQDAPIIDGVQSLREKTIAVVDGSANLFSLKRDYPKQPLLLVDTLKEALQAVTAGSADAMIGHIATVELLQKKLGITNLKVAATTPYTYNLSFAVPKHLPQLLPILEKGLATMTENEKQLIRDKWTNIRIETHPDWRLILGISTLIICISGSILLVVFVWNRRLKREIVERIKVEHKLAQAKKVAETANRAKSTFLSNMSHELRTPLTAVLGYADLLQHNQELPAKTQEQIAIIHRSGQHLHKLINNVLEIARIESGQKEPSLAPFAMNALLKDLEDMFRLQASEKGLRLSCHQSAGLPDPLVSDQGILRQILINLLGNAIKFTDSGSIALRVEYQPLNKSQVKLQISIEDTGSGIAEDQVASIFDPFEQGTNSKGLGGTGLGLAISRDYARMLGGELVVKSQLERGSQFVLTFQAEIPQGATLRQDAEPGQAFKNPAALTAKQFLLVDDEQPTRQFLRELLVSYGAQVIEAANGEEAITLAESNPPDLILMDMQMPVMDGYQAIGKLKASSKFTGPILAMSASAFVEEQLRIKAAGADAFISKPINFNELIRRVGELLQMELIETSATQPEVTAMPQLTRADLLQLSPGLRQELVDVLTTYDPDRINAIIDKIQAEHPQVCDGCRRLAADFRYDTLSDLLTKT